MESIKQTYVVWLRSATIATVLATTSTVVIRQFYFSMTWGWMS